MNGIASLAPGQAPQQGPQQGPQQPPQQGPQGGPQGTPQGMTAQLKDIPLPQLQMFMMNPGPQSPPLWAVISAIAEKQKEAKAMQMAQGDQVMAMNAQMQQQPPVAAQVMQSAQQMQEPVYAMHGGEMHGYSGGGAVAFTKAGAVPPGLLNPDVDEDGLPRGKDERQQIIDYNNRVRAAYEQQMKSKAEAPPRRAAPSMQDIAGMMAGRRQLEQFYQPRDPEAYTPERVGFKVGDAAAAIPSEASAPMRMQDTRGGTPEMPTPMISPEAAALMQRQGPRGIATVEQPPAVSRRQPAQEKPAQEKPASGINTLMGPQIDPYVRQMREAQAEKEKAAQAMMQPSAEEKRARAGIDAIMKEIIDARTNEEKRRDTLAEQRMQEARSRLGKPFYQDPAFLGEIIGGMRGAKTFYEGATGAASAAGRAQAGREAAMRAAEEKFDLSRKDIFDLQNLRQQVQLDQAKLVEARASGDQKRIAEYMDKVADSKAALAKFESDVLDKATGRRLEEKRIDVLREDSIEDRASRERIAGQQLKQQAEQNNQLQLATRINAANATVAAAYDRLNKALAPYEMLVKQVQMVPNALKDPLIAKQYKEYTDERQRLEATIVAPAIAERDRLAGMVMGGKVQKYDAQGNPLK